MVYGYTQTPSKKFRNKELKLFDGEKGYIKIDNYYIYYMRWSYINNCKVSPIIRDLVYLIELMVNDKECMVSVLPPELRELIYRNLVCNNYGDFIDL